MPLRLGAWSIRKEVEASPVLLLLPLSTLVIAHVPADHLFVNPDRRHEVAPGPEHRICAETWPGSGSKSKTANDPIRLPGETGAAYFRRVTRQLREAEP